MSQLFLSSNPSIMVAFRVYDSRVFDVSRTADFWETQIPDVEGFPLEPQVWYT